MVETREEREAQGRFVSEAEGIMRGNLNNFMDMVEYSEKFEAKVDQVNEFREKQAMIGQEKQKKQIKYGDQKETEGKAQTQGILLELYLTPHTYS